MEDFFPEEVAKKLEDEVPGLFSYDKLKGGNISSIITGRISIMKRCVNCRYCERFINSLGFTLYKCNYSCSQRGIVQAHNRCDNWESPLKISTEIEIWKLKNEN